MGPVRYRNFRGNSGHFAVIFVVPTVEEWPYQTEFSLEHFQTVLSDSSLLPPMGIPCSWHC